MKRLVQPNRIILWTLRIFNYWQFC